MAPVIASHLFAFLSASFNIVFVFSAFPSQFQQTKQRKTKAKKSKKEQQLFKLGIMRVIVKILRLSQILYEFVCMYMYLYLYMYR